jgi:hypothetical protein
MACGKVIGPTSDQPPGGSCGPVEFLYLDQEAVLAAAVLDMRRAMDVVGKAQARFAKGEVREPQKIVLRNADTADSEAQGRFNGLAASIGAPVRSAIGMKWIASFPANRRLGRPQMDRRDQRPSSSWTAFRETQLSLGEWLRSLRDIHEGVWLASDDLKPLAMLPLWWFRKRFRGGRRPASAMLSRT